MSDQYAFAQVSSTIPGPRFIRGVFLFHSITWVLSFILAKITVATPSIQQWQKDNWGVALVILIFWIGSLIATACGGRALRNGPINFLVYGLFTIFTIFLASAAVSFFNTIITYYIIGAITGAVVGNAIYAFSTKTPLSIAGAALYILAGVSIFYQIFIIFYNVSLTCLALIGIVILLLGFFMLYDVTEVIAGAAYGFEGHQSVSGSIVLWLDYILILVRICEAFTRAMRKSP
eukprot:TRINITY_DN0_c347_g1_i1.p1 TRINITY_DN0_c347_g1~~TRINITY_DN0_c347_g1_i1.p1  ORF type:complete len:233 (-),score=57.79 TRINITY_DN0_c347_g1_i1:139-837(-)